MHILNFGSLNIDDVYSVEHFVRPGETISPLSYEQFPGGKGLNQSVALACAGAEIYHAGLIGSDGLFLKELLISRGVRTDFLQEQNAPNGRAIIQVDRSGQNCIILYGGTNRQITTDRIEAVFSHFGVGDWLLLQNELNCTKALIEAGKHRGMTVVFNPSPFDEQVLKLPLHLVDWFFVNEIEGAALSDESEPECILNGIRARYPKSKTVLTLGKDGAMADDGEERAFHGIFDTKVVDTTAAGDTFTGFFLAAISAGKPLKQALKEASAASALAVSVKGASVSIPERKTVEAFLADSSRAVC